MLISDSNHREFQQSTQNHTVAQAGKVSRLLVVRQFMFSTFCLSTICQQPVRSKVCEKVTTRGGAYSSAPDPLLPMDMDANLNRTRKPRTRGLTANEVCLCYRTRWTTSFISAEQPRYNPFRLTGLKTLTIQKKSRENKARPAESTQALATPPRAIPSTCVPVKKPNSSRSTSSRTTGTTSCWDRRSSRRMP